MIPSEIDEKVITARIAAENAKRTSLSNDATIGGIMYQFEKREFPPDFSMTMPENFEELTPENLILKYPNVNRPKNILSNADSSVTFAYEAMSVNAEKSETRLKEYKAAIKRMHPNYLFYSEETYELENGLEIGCYDFRGVALDTDIYCLNFFTDLPNGELLGWFSCPIDLQARWEPLVRQMIKTIEPLSQDEDVLGG